MKIGKLITVAALGIFALRASGTVLYVDVNSATPTAPYTNWGTAAARIQDAVDAAAPGDQILVTNGIYQSGGRAVYGSLSNRVVLDKAVAVQSVNGPAVTIIQGNPVIGDSAVRCAYLTNGASLTGFALRQGATRGDQGGDGWREQSGGGAWCESVNATLTNCVLTGNQANAGGGGIHSGTLEGCILASNTVFDADLSATGGGGAVYGVLNHCTLVGNLASNAGGGASGSTLNYCIVTGNSAGQYGGGVSGSTLNNCLLTTNLSSYLGGGSSESTLNNCTLVENTANSGGGDYGGALYNCIVYYNHSPSYDSYANSYASWLVNCCTTPDAGSGNFTNAPGFVDYAGGNFHLQASSFCINGGDNEYASGSLDLEGNPRVVGPYVDVGVYEYQSAAPVPLSVSVSTAYTNVATGYAVSFTGEIGGHETASFWDFGDGTRITNQLNVSYAWPSAGSYAVTFTAWNSDHPTGVNASTTVWVLADPTYYVAQGNPSALHPYNSWATAAANLQDAVDLAYVAGTVWVSNGVYEVGGQKASGDNTTNRLVVTKPLVVQSVNGPAVTVIKGYRGPATTNDISSVRCAWLAAGVTLSGFTLTNGCSMTSAGGVRAGSSTIITNCIITGNAARGVGGGGSSGSYYNCLITGNTASAFGGGVYSGGLNNCVVVSNSAAASGGGAYSGALMNCTLVGNYSLGAGGGACNAWLRNCIAYYNNIGSVVANGTNTSEGSLYNCCTTPLAPGSGNFSNQPAFLNLAGGDFHLLASSPCINAGDNTLVTGGVDLDGNPRIQLGKVDVGAYEFQALIHYVKASGSAPRPPYINWSQAAATIQAAVDAAGPGEFIVVSNGTYQTGGRAVYGTESNVVVLTNGVTLLSLNGSQATVISGGINTRCVYVGGNSVISGFTLSGGQTKTTGDIVREVSGAGAWCETGGTVSNCLVTGNRALSGVGFGGGIYGGTVSSCTLSNNSAGNGGAAAAAVLRDCMVVSNSAPYSMPNGSGGGLYQCAATNCTLAGNGWNYCASGGGAYLSTLRSCLLVTNAAMYGGGGAQQTLLVNCTLSQNRGAAGGAYQCTNYNCVVSKNSCNGNGGGVVGGVSCNCLLVSNTASGYGGGAYQGTYYNCTLVGNVATNYSGGGVYGATVYNSILYYNAAPSGANWAGGSLISCCTFPAPGGLSSEPSFMDLAGGNFRLEPNSPCINSGNNAYLTNSTDLDGNPRLVTGMVDVGAYEFQNPVSAISYAWLQQYGIPIDASTDSADPDGDGMNNWQEWQAGTMPNNSSSVLKLLSPTADASGITVTWQSVFARTYYVQRSTNLAASPAFFPVQSNVVSPGSATSWKDFSATNAGPYFYRVGPQ